MTSARHIKNSKDQFNTIHLTAESRRTTAALWAYIVREYWGFHGNWKYTSADLLRHFRSCWTIRIAWKPSTSILIKTLTINDVIWCASRVRRNSVDQATDSASGWVPMPVDPDHTGETTRGIVAETGCRPASSTGRQSASCRDQAGLRRTPAGRWLRLTCWSLPRRDRRRRSRSIRNRTSVMDRSIPVRKNTEVNIENNKMMRMCKHSAEVTLFSKYAANFMERHCCRHDKFRI